MRRSQPGFGLVLFVPIFALAYAGGVVAYLPLLSLLLPMKIGAMTGDAKLGVLSAGMIAGALTASISNVAFGALSDHSRSRGGGRRGWLAFGILATATSYAGIAIAATPTAIVAAVAMFQLAVNALLAPLLAIMADEVPDARKGVAGGLLALGAPAASAFGAALVGLDGLGEWERLAAVPLAAAICIAPLLLTPAATTIPAPAPAHARTLRRDLVTAWASRLLVQVAGNVLSFYLLFYFESIVPSAAPPALAAWTGRLMTGVYLLSLPVALAAGRLSDRTGRRKPILLGAAALAAAGLAGMALAHRWAFGAVAFGAYAIGSAVFLALHSAFAMQLLPDARHRGRDLGLLNLTNTLPALIGPSLAWALATPRDFAPVMIVLAALTFSGGATILAIRGRR